MLRDGIPEGSAEKSSVRCIGAFLERERGPVGVENSIASTPTAQAAAPCWALAPDRRSRYARRPRLAGHPLWKTLSQDRLPKLREQPLDYPQVRRVHSAAPNVRGNLSRQTLLALPDD